MTRVPAPSRINPKFSVPTSIVKRDRTSNRKNLILSFVRDYQQNGQYFMRIQTAQSSTTPESKFIPLMDLHDVVVDEKNIGFVLHLVEGANPLQYNEIKKKEISSIKRIFSFRTQPQSSTEDTFPMHFQSESSQRIGDIFGKVKTYALDRRTSEQEK